MYLSRLILNPVSRQVQRDLADCQALHSTVLKAFPPVQGAEDARQQFGVLYRIDADRNDAMKLYVQSQVTPNWQHLRSDYAITTALKPVGELYKRIAVGTTLNFTLRANTTRKTGTTSKSQLLQGADKSNGRRVFLARAEDQLAWLERKATECGFNVNSVNLRQDQSYGSQKVSDGSVRKLKFLGVIFEGTITITDTELLQQALRQGIGPAKAYGFGLLLVAPRPKP